MIAVGASALLVTELGGWGRQLVQCGGQIAQGLRRIGVHGARGGGRLRVLVALEADLGVRGVGDLDQVRGHVEERWHRDGDVGLLVGNVHVTLHRRALQVERSGIPCAGDVELDRTRHVQLEVGRLQALKGHDRFGHDLLGVRDGRHGRAGADDEHGGCNQGREAAKHFFSPDGASIRVTAWGGCPPVGLLSNTRRYPGIETPDRRTGPGLL